MAERLGGRNGIKHLERKRIATGSFGATAADDLLGSNNGCSTDWQHFIDEKLWNPTVSILHFVGTFLGTF